MATMFETDDEFREPFPAAPGTFGTGQRITWGFNLALFALKAAYGFVLFWISGRAGANNPTGLILSSSFDLIRLATVTLLTAWLLQAFWKRLMPSLIGARMLAYPEAVAIILMIRLLFSF